MNTPFPMKKSHTTTAIHQSSNDINGVTSWLLRSLRKTTSKTRKKVAPIDTSATDHPHCFPLGDIRKLTTAQSAYDMAVIRKEQEAPMPNVSGPSRSSTNASLNELVRSLTYNARRNLSEISLMPPQYRHRNCAYQLRKNDIRVFLRTPLVSAGGMLTGTMTITLPNSNVTASKDAAAIAATDAASIALSGGIQNAALELLGIESIRDTQHGIHSHVFLCHPLIFINKASRFREFISPGKNGVTIPFAAQLPQNLDGSYKDRKGSIVYTLKGYLHVRCSCCCTQQPHKHQAAKMIPIDHQILLNSNVHSKLTTDPQLYLPLHEARTVWSHFTFPLGVQLQVSLARTIWMSGMPMYVAIRVTNYSAHNVSDIMLELLRRQHTFLRHSDEQEGSSLIPLTSSCTVSAHTSAEKSHEWDLPVLPGKTEEATLVLQTPKDQWSIRDRAFMDISFSIRVSLVSRTARSDEQALEIPIFLTHPVSVDPPPGHYLPPSEDVPDTCRQRMLDLFHAIDRHNNSSSDSSLSSRSLSSNSTGVDEDGDEILDQKRASVSHHYTFSGN